MRPTLAYSSALLVVLSLFLVHLAYGPVGVPFGAVVNALLDGANGDPAWVAIVREVLDRIDAADTLGIVGSGPVPRAFARATAPDRSTMAEEAP